MVILGTVNEKQVMDKVFYQGNAPRKMDVRKAVAHAYAKNLNVQLIIMHTGEILEWSNIIEIQGRTKQITYCMQTCLFNTPLAWYQW